MSYNRWLIPDELEHHQVKGAHWGVHNGPPYPLDRTKSDGNKLLTKGSGSPQDKKRYKTSEKTAHKRAERKARTTRDDTPKRTDKEAMLKAAKDNDLFDLDYLEAIQNEPWFYLKYDEKRVMKEYSKYLDDPEGYYKSSSSDSAGDDHKYDEVLRAPLNPSTDRKSIKDRIYNFLGKVLPSTEGQKWGVKNGSPYPVPKDELPKSFDKNPQTKNTSKEAMLKAAKDNDLFDLDYLEAIQNEPWFYLKYDEKRVMKEYSEYLDDPEKYYKNH